MAITWIFFTHEQYSYMFHLFVARRELTHILQHRVNTLPAPNRRYIYMYRPPAFIKTSFLVSLDPFMVITSIFVNADIFFTNEQYYYNICGCRQVSSLLATSLLYILTNFYTWSSSQQILPKGSLFRWAFWLQKHHHNSIKKRKFQDQAQLLNTVRANFLLYISSSFW